MRLSEELERARNAYEAAMTDRLAAGTLEDKEEAEREEQRAWRMLQEVRARLRARLAQDD